jgi:hypothetical protein
MMRVSTGVSLEIRFSVMKRKKPHSERRDISDR